MKKMNYLVYLFIGLGFQSALAMGGSGGWSMGANLGFINSDQKDLNKEIDARAPTTGTSEFGNAWELNAHITYRISGSAVALAFRPSYFMYNDGKGTGAKYALTGLTFFPTLKYYMLENQAIKFYSQFGVGYGRMTGEIEDNGLSLKYSGGNIGYMAGLGAEFCFAASHCVNVEGGVRFMSIERFTVDSSSGAAGGGSRLTQIGKGNELEIDGHDFSATMSGVLGMVGYTLYF
jgi:hypothetical protein